jgi:hypothetical protein
MPGCDPSGMAGRPKRQLTPEQERVGSRINRLRIANLILWFYFILAACLSITLTANPYDRHRYDEFPPGIVALVLLAFAIRNKAAKRSLRKKYF